MTELDRKCAMTRDELHGRISALRKECLNLLRKDGRVPYSGKARDAYDTRQSEIEDLMFFYRRAK
jgi:hypothetical protein